jgi:hypothetical protein
MTQFEQKGYTVIVFWIPSFSGLRVQRFTVRSVLSSHDRTFGSLDLVEETEDPPRFQVDAFAKQRNLEGSSLP